MAALDREKSRSPWIRRRMFSCEPAVDSADTFQPSGPLASATSARGAADYEKGAAGGRGADR